MRGPAVYEHALCTGLGPSSPRPYLCPPSLATGLGVVLLLVCLLGPAQVLPRTPTAALKQHMTVPPPGPVRHAALRRAVQPWDGHVPEAPGRGLPHDWNYLQQPGDRVASGTTSTQASSGTAPVWLPQSGNTGAWVAAGAALIGAFALALWGSVGRGAREERWAMLGYRGKGFSFPPHMQPELRFRTENLQLEYPNYKPKEPFVPAMPPPSRMPQTRLPAPDDVEEAEGDLMQLEGDQEEEEDYPGWWLDMSTDELKAAKQKLVDLGPKGVRRKRGILKTERGDLTVKVLLGECDAALAHLDYEAEGLARIAKASPLLHTPQPCLVDTFGPGASFLAAERVVKGKATKEYQKLLGQGYSEEFWDAYHALIPKQKGYDKRLKLYVIGIFLHLYIEHGPAYRGGAVKLLQKLLKDLHVYTLVPG